MKTIFVAFNWHFETISNVSFQVYDFQLLEKFLNSIRLPEKSILLDQCTNKIDANLFVLSLLETIRANIQREFSRNPYIYRLKAFKTVLENK